MTARSWLSRRRSWVAIVVRNGSNDNVLALLPRSGLGPSGLIPATEKRDSKGPDYIFVYVTTIALASCPVGLTMYIVITNSLSLLCSVVARNFIGPIGEDISI